MSKKIKEAVAVITTLSALPGGNEVKETEQAPAENPAPAVDLTIKDAEDTGGINFAGAEKDNSAPAAKKRGRVEGMVCTFKVPVGPFLRKTRWMVNFPYKFEATRKREVPEVQALFAAAMADGSFATAQAEGKGVEFMENIIQEDISDTLKLSEVAAKHGDYFMIEVGRGEMRNHRMSQLENSFNVAEAIHNQNEETPWNAENDPTLKKAEVPAGE